MAEIQGILQDSSQFRRSLKEAIAAAEDAISVVEDHVLDAEKYLVVLDGLNGDKPTVIVEMHRKHFRWLSNHFEGQRTRLETELKKMYDRRERIFAERHAAAVARLKARLEHPAQVGVSDTYSVPTLIGVERSARRKHRKPRRYVAKGERVKPPKAPQHGKRNKANKPQRGRKRVVQAA
ncbi:MAG: hypothetical protein HY567_03620 [Candidatus Kerfeldbacteria bacterium]|nr:hypothetical protein [Candidatus Kerfeldbacteria bacterium]